MSGTTDTIMEFQYQDGDEKRPVRTFDQDGEPWFVAKDVCDILGYSNPRDALKLHVDEEDRHAVGISDTIGRDQITNVINESGLYSLIMGSKKPAARKFRRWVTAEVLPSIRKRGLYATAKTAEELLSNPDYMIRVLTEIKNERAARLAAEERLEAQKPRMLFAQAVEGSDGSVLIGDFAKVLRQNGVDMGGTRLFEWMRDNGWLMKDGSSRNLPTQRGMERGFFEIVQGTRVGSHGVHVTRTTRLTGKGQVYFSGLFLATRPLFGEAEGGEMGAAS